MAAWVRFAEVRALRETAKAIECDFPEYGHRWVPLSQIGPHSEVRKEGDYGILLVPKWLAEKWREEWETSQQYEDPEWFAADSARKLKEGERLGDVLPESARIYRKLVLEFHPDRNPAHGNCMGPIKELWQSIGRELFR